MSTYLQGIPDYVPQIQATAPNLQLGMQALKMKQGAYDANKQKLSNLYGSLLNSPMLRSKDIEERDRFFKAVDQDIKKLSGMDLSLEQNVVAGNQMFNQLLDNKNIVKDMAWTKNWQNEQQRFNNLRNCTDPKECDEMWWEGGATALNFRAEEFRNATDEEAMSMSNAKAVGAIDITNMATEMANKADLNVAVDTLKGAYIFTNKNGQNVAPAIQSLLEGHIGMNPGVKAYMAEQAYVQRKTYVKQGVQAGQFESEELAERDYFEKTANTFLDQTKNQQTQINSALTSTTNLLESTKSKLEAGNIPQNAPIRKQYQDLLTTQQQLQQSSKVMEGRVADYEAFKNHGFSKTGLASLDKSIGGTMLSEQIRELSQTLSFKDMESSMEVDKIAMQKIKAKDAMELELMRQKGDLLKIKYEHDLENGATKGSPEANNGIITTDPDATIVDDENPYAALEQVTDIITENETAVSGSTQIITDRIVEASYNTIVTDVAGADKRVAKDRIVSVLDEAFALYGDDNNIKDENIIAGFTQYVSLDPDSAENNRAVGASELSENWSRMTPEQKLERVNSIGKDGVKDILSRLSADGNTELFATLSTKLTGDDAFYSKIANQSDIKSAMALGKESRTAAIAFDSWTEKQRSNVIEKVRISGEEGSPLTAEYLQAAVDEDGRVVSIGDYIKNYVSNQRTSGGRANNASLDVRKEALAKAVAAYTGNELPEYSFNPFDSDTWVKLADNVKKAHLKYIGVEVTTRTLGGIDGDKYADKFYNKTRSERGKLEEMMEGEEFEILSDLILNTSDLDEDIVNDAIQNYTEVFEGYLGNAKTGGLAETWKKSFNDYAELDDNAMLKGLGSVAGKKITYKQVDGAAPGSIGYMAFKDFSRNITQAKGDDPESVVFEVDGETSENASYIYEQLMTEIQSRNDPKDKSRPIINYSYLNTHKGREDSDKDWTKVHVDVNAAWVKQYIKDQKSGGVKAFMKITDDDVEKIVRNGMDIYLDKDKANNKLNKIMSSTPLNRAFDMNGEIDAYSDPENGTKLKLVKKNNQIILQGQMPTGYDPATNNYIYKDIYSPIDNQTGGIELQQFIKNLEEKIKAMNTDLQNSMNG